MQYASAIAAPKMTALNARRFASLGVRNVQKFLTKFKRKHVAKRRTGFATFALTEAISAFGYERIGCLTAIKSQLEAFLISANSARPLLKL